MKSKLLSKIFSYLSSSVNTQFRKNIVFSSVLYFINSILIFLSYPIYLKYLGIELFGVWAILNIVLSFAGMGNFGIGDALVKFTAEEQANDRKGNINSLFSNAFYLIIFSSFLILPLLFIFKSTIANILGIPKIYFSEASDLIPVIGLISFFYLIIDALKAILTGLGRLDLANFIFISGNILKLVFAILFFIIGYKLTALVLSMISANLIIIIVFFIVIYKTNNIILIKLTSLNFSLIKKLFHFGKNLLGSQLLSIIMLPIIKILLAHNSSIASVSYFEIGTKVPYTIRSFFQKGIYALLPKVSDLASDPSRRKEIPALIKKTTKLLLSLGVPITLLLGITSPYWMKLWLNESYNTEIAICFNIIQFGMLVSLIALPYYYTLIGIGYVRYTFYEALIRVTINIILILLIVALGGNNIYIYISFAISTIISNSFILYHGKKQIVQL